jgi:hypothetical protein
LWKTFEHVYKRLSWNIEKVWADHTAGRWILSHDTGIACLGGHGIFIGYLFKDKKKQHVTDPLQ